MSRKFKKLVRSVSEKSGVSHAGAVNLLRRGSPAVLRPLDPVLIRSKATPVSGEHTHEAGLVSAVLPDGSVAVTPACPRMTLGGLSFYRYEGIARYRAEDVRPYRLKKGERFARFVESVFDVVPYDPAASYSEDETPWIFQKPEGVESFVVGEEGQSIIAVSKPRRVIVPLWELSADLVEDGVVVGQDAVKHVLAVRDRMLAMIDCSSMGLSLSSGAPPPLPDAVPAGCEWVVQGVDDTLSMDRGMVLEAPVVAECVFLGGRYACGSGKIGRYVVAPGGRGLLLLSSEVTVVHLRRDTGRPSRS